MKRKTYTQKRKEATEQRLQTIEIIRIQKFREKRKLKESLKNENT